MSVVATGMHHAGVLRDIVMSADFLDRKSIQVSAQADGAIAAARLKNADNSDAFVHFNAERAQAADHLGLGAHFVKADLRITMKGPSQVNQTVLKGIHLRLLFCFRVILGRMSRSYHQKIANRR